jgi:hypothetical protein
MLLYLRNGLLAGLEEQPEETLRKMAGQSLGVGCVDPITCTAVITAVVAGITALTKLINSFKNVGFKEEVESVISPDLSTAPDPDNDFLSLFGGGNGDGDGEGNGEEVTVTFWNKELIPGIKNKVAVPTLGILAAGGIYLGTKEN